MFEPENDLERSLVRAAADSAHRPNFLLRMLNAQVVVVLQPDGPPASVFPDGRAASAPQSKMKLPMFRDGHHEYLPIFTALSRAKASSSRDGQPVFASVPVRKLFEQHPGKYFMLNPGHEHAQKFSSDHVNLMLAGQFGGPVVLASTPSEQNSVAKPASANAVVIEPPATTKPGPADKPVGAESTGPSSAPITPRAPAELPAVDLPKPKAPLRTPPAAAHQQSGSPPVLRPPAPPLPAINRIFSAEDEFLFDPAFVQAPAPSKPVSADKPTVPPLASAGDKAAHQPAPATPEPATPKPATPKPATAKPATPEPLASGPAAVKPSAPEKATSLKTAAVEVLAAVKRLAAKTPTSNKPEQSVATPAIPPAPAENPAAAKPTASPAPAPSSEPKTPEPKTSAPESAAVAEPVVSNPPAVTRPAEIVPSPPVFAPAPAAQKPVAPPQPPPAPSRPRVAPPPPGSSIGAANPYPVDVLFALTMAVQGMPAIDAAHLAQVQFPGRQPHLLVALDTSENWEPLAQKLRTLLPAGRMVEFTPLTGGMFEDYFRNETQPFFKRR